MAEKEYIEREAAIEAVCLCCGLHSVCEEDEYAMEGCFPRSNLNRVPAADVRPVVKAAWEDTPNPQWPAYDIRHCPCCGWSIPKSKLRAKDLDWNYCPNCGADMREES